MGTDIPALVRLINSAYRGDEARKGWTHEADLIEGSERIDATSLQEMLARKEVTILALYLNDRLAGCVYLEDKGSQLYLGMLSVDPGTQGSGIGKELLKAAEAHARSLGSKAITMTVISVRKELIAWYVRHGYTATGEREPFPGDGKFGKPRQALEFVVLEKRV